MRTLQRSSFFVMKYYYQKPDLYSPLYGERIELDHPVYKFGTLYSKDNIGIIVVQKRFDCKYCYWDSIDSWLANDIYLNPHFPIYFEQNATTERPIIEVRKLMWALRMKPLPKQYWENYI